ncbi:MAG: DUF2092 domain-containing protein, partial [Gammaproteobacteria bacterium]|nr:DUF2092 domain-containing protein [Gammaproteobacteria bacterium]
MVDNLIIALRRFCFTFVCMSLMGLPVHSAAEIDARAQEVLKRMNDYVSGLEQFTIRATTTTDDMTASGEKLQFGAAIDIQVRRPDRVRVDVNGDIQKQQLVYDGKTITLLNSDLNYYATLHAPPTIDAAMNHAADNFALNAP